MTSFEKFSSKIIPNAISAVWGKFSSQINNLLPTKNEKSETSEELILFEKISEFIKKIARSQQVLPADRDLIFKYKGLLDGLGDNQSIWRDVLKNIINQLPAYFDENSSLNLVNSFIGLNEDHSSALIEADVSVKNCVSLAFNLVGKIESNVITKVYKLTELEGVFQFESSGDLDSVFADSENCLSGKMGRENFELLKIAYTTPAIVPLLQRKMKSDKSVNIGNSGSVLALSVRGQAHFLQKMKNINFHSLEMIKPLLEDLNESGQSIFWESYSFLSEDELVERQFFELMADEKIFEQKTNLLLEKFAEIFALIDDQKKILKEHVSEEFLDKFDSFEYNYALKKRMKKLIQLVNNAKNKDEVIKILEAEKFKEEILTQSVLIENVIKDLKELPFEDALDFFRKLELRKLTGYESCIKDDFNMLDPSNYADSQMFGVSEYVFLSNSYNRAYAKDYPKDEQVLQLNIPNLLKSKNTDIFMIKYDGKVLAMRIQIENKDCIEEAGYYINNEVVNSLKIRNIVLSQGLNEYVLGVSENKKRVMFCTVVNKKLPYYLDRGGVIVGIEKAKALTKSNELIESEKLFKIEGVPGINYESKKIKREEVLNYLKYRNFYKTDTCDVYKIPTTTDEGIVEFVEKQISKKKCITQVYRLSNSTCFCVEPLLT